MKNVFNGTIYKNSMAVNGCHEYGDFLFVTDFCIP